MTWTRRGGEKGDAQAQLIRCEGQGAPQGYVEADKAIGVVAVNGFDWTIFVAAIKE